MFLQNKLRSFLLYYTKKNYLTINLILTYEKIYIITAVVRDCNDNLC